MKRKTSLVVALLIGMTCLIVGDRPASAETFVDIYAGPSFVETHDLKLDDRAVGRSTFHDVDFKTSFALGGRFGNYFKAFPYLGLAADVFTFSPSIRPQSVRIDGCLVLGGCSSATRRGGTGSLDVSETTISLDLMLRLPLLTTADAPWGRVQPYVAVGRPLFITTVDPRNTRLFRNHQSDTDLSFGYKAAGGLGVHVYKNLVLFVEYRFTHVNTDVDLEDSVSRAKATLRTDLDTHSALLGISARW